MGFWTAIEFLTILPVPARREKTAEHMGQSLVYFPVIGLILGAILLGVHYVLSIILPVLVVNALLITCLAVLTGAHHLDGFMDTCDGVIAGQSREQRLAIMADSKVGAFGIVGAVLLILLKYVSLSSAAALPALLLMPALSRWIMVVAIAAFPYAKESGMGLAFKQRAKWYRVVVATIITLVATFLLVEWGGLVVMAASLLIMLGIAGYLRARLGGLTGDTYGAINEMAEVLVLLIILVIWRV